jgi:hypothetical protein
VLVFAWSLEVGEDQEEDEEIINAQRLLDHVACKKLQCPLRTQPEEDTEIEDERDCDPEATPEQSLPRLDDVESPIGEEIEGKQAEDERPEADPNREALRYQTPATLAPRSIVADSETGLISSTHSESRA